MAIEEAAAWLLAAHDSRLLEVTLFLDRFRGDQHTYFPIGFAAERSIGPDGATIPCRDMGSLAEIIFGRVVPAARFELALRDFDLVAQVTLRAADLSAHRRLALLRRHGDREAVLPEVMDGLSASAGQT